MTNVHSLDSVHVLLTSAHSAPGVPSFVGCFFVVPSFADSLLADPSFGNSFLTVPSCVN